MDLQALQTRVAAANLDLVRHGLVTLTWGNASAVDRAAGVMAIKPSGVPYDALKPEHIVLVRLEDGSSPDDALRPSSDTPTHLELYRAFPGVSAVMHTHSTHATAWAQMGCPLPCLGTTHADHFHGPIPVVRALRAEEIENDYERAAGRSIVEWFRERDLDPVHLPAALLPGHGPFAWGADLDAAVANAVALEEVARMAFLMKAAGHMLETLDPRLLERHFSRKHGAGAYYGQDKSESE